MNRELIILSTDLANAMVAVERCPDCKSEPMLLITDDEWDVVLAHSVPCPVMVAKERAELAAL